MINWRYQNSFPNLNIFPKLPTHKHYDNLFKIINFIPEIDDNFIDKMVYEYLYFCRYISDLTVSFDKDNIKKISENCFKKLFKINLFFYLKFTPLATDLIDNFKNDIWKYLINMVMNKSIDELVKLSTNEKYWIIILYILEEYRLSDNNDVNICKILLEFSLHKINIKQDFVEKIFSYLPFTCYTGIKIMVIKNNFHINEDVINHYGIERDLNEYRLFYNICTRNYVMEKGDNTMYELEKSLWKEFMKNTHNSIYMKEKELYYHPEYDNSCIHEL